MSRVKTFNLRFRAKNYAGEPAMVSPITVHNVEHSSSAQYIDPRETYGFKEIDNLVQSFVPSFPRGLRDTTRDGVVDIHLLLAILAPNMCVSIISMIYFKGRLLFFSAQILLHDPHVDIKRQGCISAARILEAARAVLDQLYKIWATSFDLTLLDNFCSVSHEISLIRPFIDPEATLVRVFHVWESPYPFLTRSKGHR